MSNLSNTQLADAVNETVDHAAAPVGSVKNLRTVEVIGRFVEEADTRDGWLFLTGLCQTIIVTLGLDRMECPCGSSDPEHKAVVEFGFAPMGDDGEPDATRGFFGTAENAPQEVQDNNPQAISLARIITAQIGKDAGASVAAWQEALEGGWMLQLLYLAAQQAGEVRRLALAQAGGN